MRNPTAPNWPVVIEQIVSAGVSREVISRRIDLSQRGVRYLEAGIQPMFHRGDLLLALWCECTGQARAEVPMAKVLVGYRKGRQPVDRSPSFARTDILPNWPPVQKIEMQGKKRRKKEAV